MCGKEAGQRPACSLLMGASACPSCSLPWPAGVVPARHPPPPQHSVFPGESAGPGERYLTIQSMDRTLKRTEACIMPASSYMARHYLASAHAALPQRTSTHL